MRIRRVVALVAAVVAAVTFWATVAPLVAQQRNNNNNNQRPQRNKTEQVDVETLVRLVDGVAGGIQQAPAGRAHRLGEQSLREGPGRHHVPAVHAEHRPLEVEQGRRGVLRSRGQQEPGAGSGARARRRSEGRREEPAAAAAPVYPWDNISFIEIPSSGKLSRAIALRPGQYEAFIAIKEKGTDQRNAPPSKMGLLRKDLSIPDFNVPELATSSILVASAIEVLAAPLPPAQQEENPYVFGPMKIGLSPDGKFSKSGELNLVFWIYGAGAAAAGKPDVQVDYAFHQKLAEGEKYFNRTQPQVLNAQSLPPEFDVAAGHQLPGTLTVPLASFPSGDYRLEIKVTDKTSGKSVVQNVSFTVLPA